MADFELIATMAAGIEALTAKELKKLGYQVQTENGRVRFTGDLADIARTNIWLRTADRIKIVVGEFEAKTFDELFEGIKALPWDDYLPLDASFPVAGKSVGSILHSTPDVQAITKKAIVDKMSEVYHRRARLAETGAVYPLEVSIVKNHVMMTLDTTGSSLFKRGYRLEKGGAPMKENLAASLILLTNWYPDMPFVDPTTGSGTIAIEAALIGRNIAPGLYRKFSFEEFQWFDTDILKNEKEAAQSQINQDIELDIFASDIDDSMIEVAKENADNAGVLADITFKHIALKDFTTVKKNGVIVSNPPYGHRLSDAQSVKTLYREMGKVFGSLTSWSKYIFTSDLDFETYYGQKATKRRKLYNGAIRADLFQFWGKREK